MIKLRHLKLRQGVDSPALPPPVTLMDSRTRDRFDAAVDGVELIGMPAYVRIIGQYGVSLQPWANVLEAWELEEPTTNTETAKAAAPKARGAK